MRKKVVALLLVAAMTCSMAACGGSDPTTDPTTGSTTTSTDDSSTASDSNSGDDGDLFASNTVGMMNEYEADYSSKIPTDTVTLTVSSQTANTNAEQLGWFADVMLEKFNVKLNTICSKGDQFTTLMESGNLGDIVMFGEIGTNFTDSVANGYLLDWNEDDLMQNYAPYIYSLKDTDLKKVFEKSTGATGLNDGAIYSIGNDIASGDTHQLFIYYPCMRWDLYKELGYPDITTLEDYVDVLADMQALEPESDIGTKTYGVSLHTAWETTAFMVMYVKSTAAFYGWDEFHCGLYNSETDEFQGCLQEDGIYFRCLKFYNTLNQRGLVDPDSETNGWSEVQEAMANGETLMDIYNYVGTNYNTPEHLSAGKAMVPIVADDFTTLVYGMNNYGGNYQIAIGAKTEYPELCMAIINWWFTPSGAMTILYGPEAETASPDDTTGCWYYDADGYTYLTDLGLNCQLNGDTLINGTKFSEGTAGFNNTTWAKDAANPESNGETFNYENWASYSGLNDYDIIKDYYDYYGVSSFDEAIEKATNGNYVVVPATEYKSTTQSKALKATYAYVYDVVKSYSWLAIKATNDDDYQKYVDQMIEQATALGYDECLEYSEQEAAIRKDLEDAVDGN